MAMGFITGAIGLPFEFLLGLVVPRLRGLVTIWCGRHGFKGQGVVVQWQTEK